MRFKILIFVILIGFLIGASRVSANDAYLADDAAALQGSGGGGAPMPGIYSGSCGSSSCAFQLRPGFSFTNPFPRTIAVGQHLMIDVFLKNDSITDAIFPLHDNISSLALVAAGDLGNVDPGATLGTQPQCLGYGAPALWLELRFGTTYSTPGLHTVTVTAYQCGPIGAGVPDSGQVIGTAFSHSFQINVMPTSVELVDPAPGLISGTTLTTSTGALATGGRIVSGSAADGVTQALIRIKTANPGEQFAVTLLDDHQTPAVQSTSSAEDGALGNPGDTNFSQSQINVISSSPGGSGPAYAFAVYRAPIEFARPFGSGYRSGLCRGQTASDDQLACRSVSVQVQDLTTSGTAPVTFSILIVRPPVALIHGLWADWKIWNAFSPLVSSKSAVDPRFSVLRVDFSNPVGTSLTSSTPQYSIGPNSARANSLGFQYNAPGVLKQISDWIQQFRLGNNRAGAAVAATQVDIVTHSMGANLARTMVLLPQFLNSPTFNQGVIHKVVTIDAPHLGSPLAAQLLGSTSDCTRELLASNENYTFTSVTISGRGSVNGGVGDLVGNGTAVDSSLSAGLQAIAQPGPHLLPTALIAGVYNNFASLDCTTTSGVPCAAQYIRTRCGKNGDLLGQKFTSTAWPLIFGPAGNNSNDAIVSQTSQFNGLGVSAGNVFTGFVHSVGTEQLSFTGPSVLDPSSPIPNQVIQLLNTPYTQAVFHGLNP